MSTKPEVYPLSPFNNPGYNATRQVGAVRDAHPLAFA